MVLTSDADIPKHYTMSVWTRVYAMCLFKPCQIQLLKKKRPCCGRGAPAQQIALAAAQTCACRAVGGAVTHSARWGLCAGSVAAVPAPSPASSPAPSRSISAVWRTETEAFEW